MVWSILFSSLAPKACAIGIPKPAASPKTNPIIKKFNEPVEPTAARAFVPQAWPTIMVSTVLYSCWKKLPINIGKKKKSNW